MLHPDQTWLCRTCLLFLSRVPLESASPSAPLGPSGNLENFLWNSESHTPNRCARTFAHLMVCSRRLRIRTISPSASLKHALSIRPWSGSPGAVIKTVLCWINPMQFSKSHHLGISPATAEHLASNFWACSFVFLPTILETLFRVTSAKGREQYTLILTLCRRSDKLVYFLCLTEMVGVGNGGNILTYHIFNHWLMEFGKDLFFLKFPSLCLVSCVIPLISPGMWQYFQSRPKS